MGQHAVTEIAKSAGINMSANFKATSAPQVNNVGAHIGAVKEASSKLSTANDIRAEVASSLGDKVQPSGDSGGSGWADALKSNVVTGVAAAGLTAIGLSPIAIGLTALSTAKTIISATQSTNESTYFKSAIDEKAEEEGYASYAETVSPSSTQQQVAPATSSEESGLSSTGPQFKQAIDDVVSRIGEEELIEQMGHLSQEEIALQGQLIHHQTHIDTIASGPSPAMA